MRNRYLHVHATDEWKVQPNIAAHSNETEREDKYRTTYIRMMQILSV